MRLLLRLLYEVVSRVDDAERAVQNNNNNAVNSNLQLSAKLIDILDIFGIVWFAVGNLVVFNNFGCVDTSPIVFLSCFFYIILSYLNFLSPSLIRCTLRMCPPSSQQDLNYIRLIETTDNMANMLRRNNHFPPNNLDGNLELTDERSTYWTNWLQSYGCSEFRYNHNLNLADKDSGTTVGSTRIDTATHRESANGVEAVEDDLNTCAICLSTFEDIVSNVQCSSTMEVDSIEAVRTTSGSGEVDNSIIVQYPCRGRHFFHAHCLKTWLHASSMQHQNNRYRMGMIPPNEFVTCPCCRELPSALNDTANSTGRSSS